MSTLCDLLAAPSVRPQVLTDCEKLLDEEVASKGGLTGLAVKGAFAVVKKVKPGFIHEVIDNLLGDFCTKLDPQYQAAKQKDEPVSSYFNAHSGEVAEALLAITDDRARRAKHQLLKGTYDKLRPSAKTHVEAAVPRIGRLVAKYDTNSS
jgi:hypothetical protein